MGGYVRTMIKTLTVRGYRSLRDVALADLPEVIVLYGPNGSGKSNVLNAARLALRAATYASTHAPTGRERPGQIAWEIANKELELRPADFSHGEQPEIRVALEIACGARFLSGRGGIDLGSLFLDVVFQNRGGPNLFYWFERADIDRQIGLSFREGPPPAETSAQIAGARDELERLQARIRQLADDSKSAEADLNKASLQLTRLQQAGPGISGAAAASKRAHEEKRARLQNEEQQRASERLEVQAQVLAQQQRIMALEKRVEPEKLVAARVVSEVIPKLVQASSAYRTPNNHENPAEALFDAFLSEDDKQFEAAKALGRRLGQAGFFGSSGAPVELSPVQSFEERQIRLAHPAHGSLTIRNLGTGEQQLLFILAQRVLTQHPIVLLEEPEAHLHKTLMEALARVLAASVASDDSQEPDIDQLWIATHHHYFALAPVFFDMKQDEKGFTRIERQPRERAVNHFYEPGPYWEALRSLVGQGMPPDTIVYRDPSGLAATAKDVLASIEGDRVLAQRFVEAATRSFVLSLTDEPAEPPT